MKLAFCGLGQMGEPMAATLLEAGHELVVWNRTPERGQALVERGARQAASPAEAAASAEAVITMLATPGALEEVVTGDDGVSGGIREESVFIEMSTVGPDLVRSLAQRLPDGVAVVDAPVLGSVKAATEGSLQVFVGGTETAFQRTRPVLEAFGSVVHLGPLGSGAAMKLVANAVLGTLMSGLGEALALADGLGLDQSQVLDVLSQSPIGATAKSKRDNVESGTYPPNFKLSLAVKDLRLVTEAARRAGVELRLAGDAEAWFEAADEAGLGALDYSAIIAHIRGQEAGGA